MPTKLDDDTSSRPDLRPDFLQDMGISPGEQKEMGKKAHDGAAKDIADRAGLSGDSLKGAEEAGSTHKASSADNIESEATGESLYRDENKKGSKKKGRFTRNQKIAGGGIAGLLIGGSIGILSVVQGPLQIISFANLLQRFHFGNNERFGDGRTSRLIRNWRKSGVERSRLGLAGNKIADRYERKFQDRTGMRSVYDETSGRFLGYEVTDRGKANNFMQEAGLNEEGDVKINDAGDPNTPRSGRSFDPDGRRVPVTGEFIDLSDQKFSGRRSFIRTATKGTNTGKLAGSLGARLLIKRAGVDFHPLKNVKRKAGDTLLDYYRTRREARAERRRNGVNSPNINPLTGEKTTDKDGNPIDDPNNTGAANEANDALDTGKTGDLDATRTKISAKLSGGASSVVGVICAVKAVGNASQAIKHANIILPLIRIGVEIAATGNQVMSGKGVNLDELGSISKDLYDDDAKSSWAAAASIQGELGEARTGPDMPEIAKPGNALEKPAFFQRVDSIPGVGTACGDNILTKALNFFDVTGLIIGMGLNALGVDPAGALIDWIARAISGNEINGFAKGAELGNYANYGSRLAANDQAIGTGGRELSGTEVIALDTASRQEKEFELSNRTFFAKYLDIDDTDSVLAQAIIKTPDSPSKALASIVRSPFNFGSLFTGKVKAQQQPYDYGFNEFGFSLDEQNDLRVEDPFANAEWVEQGDRLEQLNEKYSDCFSMQVDPLGNLVNGDAKRYDEIKDECKSTTNEELLRYRFYIADTINMHTLSCYEGNESSCNQLFSAGTGQPSGAGKIEGDPYSDSSNVQCAPGTKDIGINKGYVSGNEFAVRLCSLPNLPSSGQADSPGNQYSTPGADGHAIVNSRVSGAWFSLVNDAKADGITLRTFSSFRSMSHQQALWDAKPDNSLVARPGYSSHQAGVALDLNEMDDSNKLGSCENRARVPSSKAWVWMRDNAENYGFKQFSNEAWHWDALPMANRCGTAQP